ncbi:hypothetical protein PYCC9005_001504 [Savitreella phatthalungensis]
MLDDPANPFASAARNNSPAPPGQDVLKAKASIERQLDELDRQLRDVMQVAKPLLGLKDKLQRQVRAIDKHRDGNGNSENIPPDVSARLNLLEKETESTLAQTNVRASPIRKQQSLAGPLTPTNMLSPAPRSRRNHSAVKLHPNQVGATTTNNIEFAANLGEQLIVRVRELQSLLAERDEQLRQVTAQKQKLEVRVETAEETARTGDARESRDKDLLWNAEVQVSELQGSLAAVEAREEKLKLDNARLTSQIKQQQEEMDTLRTNEDELRGQVSDIRGHYTATATEFKVERDLARQERESLYDEISRLKSELEEKNAVRLTRMVSPQKAAPERPEEPSTPVRSPIMSPVKQTPSRNPHLEAETMKGSLEHMMGQLQRARKTAEREKAEKLKLRKELDLVLEELSKLQEEHAQLEQLKVSKVGRSMGASQRGGDGRRTRGRPELMGASRRATSEVSSLVSESENEREHDDSWNDAESDLETAGRRTPTQRRAHNGEDSLYSSPRSYVAAPLDLSAELAGISTSPPTMQKHSGLDLAAELETAEAQSEEQTGPETREIGTMTDPIAPEIPARSTARLSRASRASVSAPEGMSLVPDVPTKALERRLSKADDQSLLVNQLKSEVESLSSALHAAKFEEEALAAQTTARRAAESDLAELRARHAAQLEDNTEQLAQVTALSDRIVILENDAALAHQLATEAAKSHEMQVRALQQQLACADIESKDAGVLSRRLQEELAALRADHADELTRADGVASELSALRERHEAAARRALEADDLEADVDALKAELKTLEQRRLSDLAKASTVVEELRAQIAALQAELDTLRATSDKKLAEAHARTDALAMDITSAQGLVTLAKQKLDTQAAGHQAQVHDLEQDLAEAKELLIMQEKRFAEELNVSRNDATMITKDPVDEMIEELTKAGNVESLGIAETQDIPATAPEQSEPVPVKAPAMAKNPSQASTTGSLEELRDDEFERDFEHYSPQASVRGMRLQSRRHRNDVRATSPARSSPLAKLTGSDIPVKTIGIPVRNTDMPPPLHPSTAPAATRAKKVNRTQPHGVLFDYEHGRDLQPQADAAHATGTEDAARPDRGSAGSEMTFRPVQPPRLSAMNVPRRSIAPTPGAVDLMARSQSAMSMATMTSAASDLEERPVLAYRPVTPSSDMASSGSQADALTIESITRCMIGMPMYKYTRRTARQGLSDNRHRRYVWLHPYTRTLYWSIFSPMNAPESTIIKSAPILAIHVESDFNPHPPGLCQKSIYVATPTRPIKMTALQTADHDDWVRALDFLVNGPPATAIDRVASPGQQLAARTGSLSRSISTILRSPSASQRIEMARDRSTGSLGSRLMADRHEADETDAVAAGMAAEAEAMREHDSYHRVVQELSPPHRALPSHGLISDADAVSTPPKRHLSKSRTSPNLAHALSPGGTNTVLISSPSKNLLAEVESKTTVGGLKKSSSRWSLLAKSPLKWRSAKNLAALAQDSETDGSEVAETASPVIVRRAPGAPVPRQLSLDDIALPLAEQGQPHAALLNITRPSTSQSFRTADDELPPSARMPPPSTLPTDDRGLQRDGRSRVVTGGADARYVADTSLFRKSSASYASAVSSARDLEPADVRAVTSSGSTPIKQRKRLSALLSPSHLSKSTTAASPSSKPASHLPRSLSSLSRRAEAELHSRQPPPTATGRRESLHGSGTYDMLDDMLLHAHDGGLGGLENVRECCGGKHDVSHLCRPPSTGRIPSAGSINSVHAIIAHHQSTSAPAATSNDHVFATR